MSGGKIIFLLMILSASQAIPVYKLKYFNVLTNTTVTITYPMNAGTALRLVTHVSRAYTVIHLLVVDVACVLFWTQSVCMVPNQNTRNIYHKQMNNGVQRV